MPENKFMEVIYTSSGRLIEVLNQTTILSQAAFGETIPKETLSLNALIKETVDEFAVDLSTVEMECKVAKAPDVIIQANPLIREVFKNYISNAIKYAKDGKRIVLETVIEDQAVIVCVKDFGKTIAEADRDQIFERQVQLENGKERGRGLGLAIVKRIAGAHGGEAWVEPNKPQGNSFCLRIPHLKQTSNLLATKTCKALLYKGLHTAEKPRVDDSNLSLLRFVILVSKEQWVILNNPG